MNSPYDLKESAVLIAKLITLTRDGKVEWREQKSLLMGPASTRYTSGLEANSEALVWSTDKSVGFKVIEKVYGKAEAEVGTLGSERDLISISIDHESGPSRGELFINLMSLLELARRASDKVEPKIERVKEYLDKLAV